MTVNGQARSSSHGGPSPTATERPTRANRPISIAPTTASNVKAIVADSKFHDETLCQLLDAARLNLVGDEAKKALRKAAKARVRQLNDFREEGEVSLQLLRAVAECSWRTSCT